MMVPPRAEDFDRALLWRFRAQALRIIDGDTFIALVDTGFRGRHEAIIRLLGVDSPERGNDGYREAIDRLTGVLDETYTAWPLRVVSHQRETIVAETTSFERYVAEVFVLRPNPEGVIVVRSLAELL